jgi:HEAT repeat protein
MLEGLDQIDWGRLNHAYGEAVDVPGFIRALLSPDQDERNDALYELFDNIWHQGTVYEATAFAVPFLIELLAEPHVGGKEGILHLLASIVAGRSYIDLHAGGFERMRTAAGSEGEREDREAQRARELGWVRAAAQAVEAGVTTYLGLLTDDDPEVRIFATYALGRCGGRAAQIVRELVARVSVETDARTRAALVLAKGALEAAAGQPGDASAFIAERMGPQEQPVVRLAAALALAKSSPAEPGREVLETLALATGPAWSDFERLPWCEGGVAVCVGEALAEVPEARLHFLLGLLENEDDAVRSGARGAIEELCRARRSVARLAAAALGERVCAGAPADRRGAALILGRLGPAAAAAVDPLSAALLDDDLQLRTAAALALAGLRDSRAIPVLIARLDDERAFSAIVSALGGFGAAAGNAVPVLVDLLNREPPCDAISADNRPIQIAEALGQIGPDARPAVPALVALLKKYPRTRQATALALAQIGGPAARGAVPFLEKLLGSQDEPVCIRAAQALWRIDQRTEVALPVLIERLRPGGMNRWLAALALGEMGELARDALPALRACLGDSSFDASWVRLEAARAIWRIACRAEWSIPVLAALLKDPSAVGPLIATKAAEALGEMGPAARQCVPVLRAAVAGDLRPFRATADSVMQDEAFCSAVAASLRKIEGDA